MAGARLSLSAPSCGRVQRQLVQVRGQNARQAWLDLDVMRQQGRGIWRQAWAGQLVEAEIDPGVQPAVRRLAAEAKQEVLHRQPADPGDLDLQPVHRLLEAHFGQHVLQGVDDQAQLRPGGSGQIGLVPPGRDVRGQRADQAAARGQQSRDALPIHALDPDNPAHGLDADRHRRAAADLRGGFPAVHRRIRGEIEPPVLGWRQRGVREIAIEALLLSLLRVIRGQHDVAELGVERRCSGQRRIDHTVGVLPADAEIELHRHARAGYRRPTGCSW